MIERSPHASACRLTLQPDDKALAALVATLTARDELFSWLDATVPASQSSDLVALNRLFYEAARGRFALPAQMTVLALRDWTRRRRGETVEGLALDDKLFSIRMISLVSIATIYGRHHIPFHMSGYLPGWRDNATARLLRRPHGYEIRVASETVISTEEASMATESIVGRIGRLIAGMRHGALFLPVFHSISWVNLKTLRLDVSRPSGKARRLRARGADQCGQRPGAQWP
jgi:hypothetical protein